MLFLDVLTYELCISFKLLGFSRVIIEIFKLYQYKSIIRTKVPCVQFLKLCQYKSTMRTNITCV